MIDGKKVLAIIPARGGSKRLPRKNILPLHGKPLIAWSIEAGLNSQYIDRVVVSTDCEDIAKVAIDFGAEVPCLRPSDLSGDEARSIDVIMHTLSLYEKDSFELVIILQPTSPLRTDYDINEAFEVFKKEGAKKVVSVCLVEHPSQWCGVIPSSGSLSNFLKKENENSQSQQFSPEYRLNGAIYIAEVECLIEERVFIGGSASFAYKMPAERSLDIDTKLDFDICQFLIEN